MLRMWRAVAAGAITDAAREITRSHGKDREIAIDYHTRYFNGRDWREVCETAGITHNPDAVMRFLTSDKARPTAQGCQVSMGVTTRSQEAAE
ncbi:hypothetical protein BMI85_16160 [Thioclava sp. DLFJ4-1]|nr:hypothetical protein BMI85_16160 [Thioclava sp. DLFJ4-1]